MIPIRRLLTFILLVSAVFTTRVPQVAAQAQSAKTDAKRSESTLDQLEQEYQRLRDQIFISHATAEALAREQYSTTLRIHLQHTPPRNFIVQRARIDLDGIEVFVDREGAISANAAPRFSGRIAPGLHAITVYVEGHFREDPRFRAQTSTTLTLLASRDETLAVRVRVEDEADIARTWKRRRRGSYHLQLDAKIETVHKETLQPR